MPSATPPVDVPTHLVEAARAAVDDKISFDPFVLAAHAAYFRADPELFARPPISRCSSSSRSYAARGVCRLPNRNTYRSQARPPESRPKWRIFPDSQSEISLDSAR